MDQKLIDFAIERGYFKLEEIAGLSQIDKDCIEQAWNAHEYSQGRQKIQRRVVTINEKGDRVLGETYFAYIGESYEEAMAREANEVDIMDVPINGTFFEMAALKGGFMSIKLSVWGDEGKYPHFHFYHGVSPNQGIPNKGHGGGCILIKEAKYFIHGSHRDTMEKKEIEGLIKFLKSKHPIYGISIWKVIIDTWNENNRDQPQVSLDAPIPPYKHNMPSIKEDS